MPAGDPTSLCVLKLHPDLSEHGCLRCSCLILDLSIIKIWPAGYHRLPMPDRDLPSDLLLQLDETLEFPWTGPPRRDRFYDIAVGSH